MQVDHEMEVVVAHPLVSPSNVLVLDIPLVERSPMQGEMVPNVQVQQAKAVVVDIVPFKVLSMLEAD